MPKSGSTAPARPKIIIVEDSADDEALLMRQLKKAGLNEHVLVIRDGREALRFFERGPVDLSAVFLDLRLPKIDGIRLLEFIRTDEHLNDLPVVIMTSSNSPEELERCRELKASNYVQKPLTFSSFAKAFADIFHARQIASRMSG